MLIYVRKSYCLKACALELLWWMSISMWMVTQDAHHTQNTGVHQHPRATAHQTPHPTLHTLHTQIHSVGGGMVILKS
jgi:hypothetical protein